MQEPCSISGKEFSYRFETDQTGRCDGFLAQVGGADERARSSFGSRVPKTWADAEKLPGRSFAEPNHQGNSFDHHRLCNDARICSYILALDWYSLKVTNKTSESYNFLLLEIVGFLILAV